MTQTWAYTGTLTVMECADCNITFGVTPRLERDRRRDHQTFYCPCGHSNYFPHQTTEEKLRAELARAEGAVAEERQRTKRARSERDQTRRRLSAAKGQVTKIKNRVGRGVCPCCSRSFENVARHMKSKHPGYSSEGAD